MGESLPFVTKEMHLKTYSNNLRRESSVFRSNGAIAIEFRVKIIESSDNIGHISGRDIEAIISLVGQLK